MEMLSLHIEYLLTRHDCVIVPGFGAFIATETEATIDFEQGIISPRRRETSFNASVVTDDGLLTHSIARREHLSYEEARKLLFSATEKMRSDLQEEGEVSLGMIGRLVMDSDRLIAFEPRRSGIQADILPSLQLPRLQSETDREESKADNPAKDFDAAGDYYVIRLNKRAVHAAAMLVAILTVGISLLIPINHDNEQKASVVPLPTLNIPTMEADTVSDTAGEHIMPEMSDMQ